MAQETQRLPSPTALVVDLSHAATETPRVSEWWRLASDAEREAFVLGTIAHEPVRLLSAKASGVVLLQLTGDLPAAKRGPLLLSIERKLAGSQPGIEVYLQAQVDKNALRKLRGVQIGELA